MAFSPKKRKDSWTVGHEGGYNNDQTNHHALAKKDSTKSIIPTVNRDQYVFFY